LWIVAFSLDIDLALNEIAHLDSHVVSEPGEPDKKQEFGLGLYHYPQATLSKMGSTFSIQSALARRPARKSLTEGAATKKIPYQPNQLLLFIQPS
jgi:hypothetical protein